MTILSSSYIQVKSNEFSTTSSILSTPYTLFTSLNSSIFPISSISTNPFISSATKIELSSTSLKSTSFFSSQIYHQDEEKKNF